MTYKKFWLSAAIVVAILLLSPGCGSNSPTAPGKFEIKAFRAAGKELSWLVTGDVASATAQITPEVGAVNLPSGSVVVSPEKDTTYTLTVTKGTTNLTATVKVVVEDEIAENSIKIDGSTLNPPRGSTVVARGPTAWVDVIHGANTTGKQLVVRVASLWYKGTRVKMGSGYPKTILVDAHAGVVSIGFQLGGEPGSKPRVESARVVLEEDFASRIIETKNLKLEYNY